MPIKTIKLNITGMTCGGCARSVEKSLNGEIGIIEKDVSYPEKLGVFKFDDEKTTKERIIEIINSTRYKVADEVNDGLPAAEEGKKREEIPAGFDYDLIIIGGGSAAFSAAIKASGLGKKTLMINEGLPIGGSCVNVGCVPSKTLIRNAEQFYYSNYPNFKGIEPGGNKLNFKAAIKQKTELVESLRQGKYIDVLKDDERVTILKGRAALENSTTVTVNNRKFSAEKILISTGSSTFIPDIPGLAESDYLTNEAVYDLEELPERLIIIGGRYIALENAQLFSRLGSKVTILQRSARILPDQTPDISIGLTEILKNEGIEILTGVKINSVKSSGEKILVDASAMGVEKMIVGDKIFIAAGRKGNSGNFDRHGIQTTEKGFVKTNNFMQTNVPNIYAAGDITGEFLFVYSAAYEGALAVENMFGGNKKEKNYDVFPWVIFTDPQAAGVGLDEDEAYKKGIDYETSTIQMKDVPRSLAARNTKGFIKLIRNKNNDKLIGARILASEGSELLMELSMAIKYGITVAEIKSMFHPYLTLSEGVKIAAIGFDADVKKLSCCAV